MSVESIIKKLSGNIIDLIYSSEKKYERYVLLLALVGFIIRLVAAHNLGTLADDAVYASQSAGIWDAGILSTHSNPPLFFYLTDLAYKIIGYNMIGSRFFVVLSGALLIVVVFLISEKFFNKKVALASAVFTTFSNFLIRMTFTEHSMVVFLFLFSGIYIWLLYLDSRSKIYFFASAIFLGLALLTKYNAPFFILSLAVFSLVYLRSKNETFLNKKNLKAIISLVMILVLFSLPFISFNYFIYKEKGILDVYFSRVFQLESTQQLYSGLAGQQNSFFDNALNPINYGNYSTVLKTDPILFLFALGGLIFLFRKKEKLPLYFFFIFLIIPFVFQSAGSPLPKHFAFMHILFSLPAGYFVNELSQVVKSSSLRKAMLFVLIVILIFNIGFQRLTPENFSSASANSQAKEYLLDNAKPNDLLVFDPRIYTPQSYFMATPNKFMNLFDFGNLYSQSEKIQNPDRTSVNVYFVECIPEDCGWGTIKDQQQLNQTTEAYFEELSKVFAPQEVISARKPVGNEFLVKEKEEVYRIYKGEFKLNPADIDAINKMNRFYFVPYLYLDMSDYIYNYQIYTFSQGIMQAVARLILKISIFLALVAFFIPIILLGNSKANKTPTLP